MTSAGLRAAVVVALVVMTAARETPAAEPPPPVENTKAAREHYRAGVMHYDLAEYGPALERFKAAYRVVQDPSLLFNIAQCHRKLGQRADALSFYRSYLRRSPEGPNRGEAELHIRELERAPAPTVPEATTPAPKTPPPTTTPGSAGPAVPAASSPPEAPLVVTPLSPAAPAAPARSAGMSNRRIVALVAGGAGLLAIGIGSAVALSARSSYDDAVDRCPGKICIDLDDKDAVDAARSRGDLATAIWIGGLAALATGAVLWLTEPSHPTALAARPLVGAGVGGVALAGVLP